jgi:hypothetical protein
MGGTTRSLRSCQHDPQGHWGAQTPFPRQGGSPREGILIRFPRRRSEDSVFCTHRLWTHHRDFQSVFLRSSASVIHGRRNCLAQGPRWIGKALPKVCVEVVIDLIQRRTVCYALSVLGLGGHSNDIDYGLPLFTRKDFEIPENPSIRIVCLRAQNRTLGLPNMNMSVQHPSVISDSIRQLLVAPESYATCQLWTATIKRKVYTVLLLCQHWLQWFIGYGYQGC